MGRSEVNCGQNAQHAMQRDVRPGHTRALGSLGFWPAWLPHPLIHLHMAARLHGGLMNPLQSEKERGGGEENGEMSFPDFKSRSGLAAKVSRQRSAA